MISGYTDSRQLLNEHCQDENQLVGEIEFEAKCGHPVSVQWILDMASRIANRQTRPKEENGREKA